MLFLDSLPLNYKNVADYFSKQVEDNAVVVQRLKDEFYSMHQSHESRVNQVKTKFSQCQNHRHESGGGNKAVVAVRASSASRGEAKYASRSISPGAAKRRARGDRTKRRRTIATTSTSRKTNSSSQSTDVVASSMKKEQGQMHPQQQAEEEEGEDLFRQLLSENEALAREVEAKRATIDLLAQRLVESGVTTTNDGGHVEPDTRFSTCPRCHGNERGDHSRSSSRRTKKTARILLQKLEAKVQENQELLRKLEGCRLEKELKEDTTTDVDTSVAKLLKENLHLRERLRSCLSHRRTLEAEAAKGSQVAATCQQEKLRLERKMEQLQEGGAVRPIKSAVTSPAADAPSLHKSKSFRL